MTELQRIEILDVSVWMAARNGLTALATKHYLDWQFYGIEEDERKKVYKTNVANNILYASNNALIDTAVVETAEHIKSESQRGKLPFTVPDLGILFDHRDVISHPGTVEFSNPKVQAFYKSHGQYKDPKALRLWRARQAILDWLQKNGSTRIYPNAVQVQSGTVEMIWAVLNLSAKEGAVPPSLSEVYKTVPPYFAAYEESLKKNAASEPSK